MKPWLAITHLLSVLAILGLVLAPLTAPAVAGAMVAPEAMADAGMDMASAGDVVAMAEMPCCPPEKPITPDCQKACPLAALCLAKIVQGVVFASAVPARFSMALSLIPGNDANPKTLALAPPSRPPQT